jgi:hypothetical protein
VDVDHVNGLTCDIQLVVHLDDHEDCIGIKVSFYATLPGLKTAALPAGGLEETFQHPRYLDSDKKMTLLSFHKLGQYQSSQRTAGKPF